MKALRVTTAFVAATVALASLSSCKAIVEQFTWKPYGTWVNTRYDADGPEPDPMAKLVIKDDGPDVVELYDNTGDTSSAQTIQFEITDHWTVGQTQWFLFPVDLGTEIYFVMRISAENTVLEIASSSDDTRPTEIDPETSDTYVIYSRQEE